MTQLTCPKCGTSFETEARTNTRCRRCKHVVNVPRGRRNGPNVSRHFFGASLEALDAALWRLPADDDPDPDLDGAIAALGEPLASAMRLYIEYLVTT